MEQEEPRQAKNVSFMLCPNDHTSLLQVRDDEASKPLQFPGGWCKVYDKNGASYLSWDEINRLTPEERKRQEEPLDQAVVRECIEEFGLWPASATFMPFDLHFMGGYTLVREGKPDAQVYLTSIPINPDWIGNLQRIKEEDEVGGKLNLREGSSIGLYPLSEELLRENLYGNDRRMMEMYLHDRAKIDQAAFKIGLQHVRFPEPIQQKLEAMVTVRA